MYNFKQITKINFEKINREKYFSNDKFNVIISCKYIQTWEQMAEALGNAFQFPMRNEGLDGTWDWMTDLSWLGMKENIDIYLYQEECLFAKNYELKMQVYKWFSEIIQFWEKDVLDAYIAGMQGKPKHVSIYLVN